MYNNFKHNTALTLHEKTAMEEVQQPYDKLLEDTTKLSLTLSNMKLRSIPTKLLSFEKLLKLDLSTNFLSEITILPKKLIDLDISNNQLSYLFIPDEYSNLRIVRASNNNITVINNLPVSIKALDISSNKLTELQPIFSSLVNLIKLDIDNNDDITELNNIPPSLTKLSASCSLITIDNLENTNIVDLNASFCNISVITKLPKNIKKLNLGYSDIEQFMPESIIPDTLEDLDLHGNSVDVLCPHFLLSNIKNLNLSNCELRFLPKLNFDMLETLDISNNNFMNSNPVSNSDILKLSDYKGPRRIYTIKHDCDNDNDPIRTWIQNRRFMELRKRMFMEKMKKRSRIESLKNPDYIILNKEEIDV